LPEPPIYGPQTRLREVDPYGDTATAFSSTDDPNNGHVVEEDSRTPWRIAGTQITVSEGHPFPPPKGSLADVGGEFFSQKSYVKTPIRNRTLAASFKRFNDFQSVSRKYHGYILPIMPPGPGSTTPWPAALNSSKEALSAIGATAIATCKPDNPIANLSTTLGETFREGIPHLVGSTLWESKIKAAQKAGHEYLNVQFGWLPLLNDISDFVGGVANANAVLAQYERDAGGVVRRSFGFPSTYTSSEEVVSGTTASVVGTGANILSGATGVRTWRREIRRRRWFSGAFTYYLPSGYDSRNEMDRIGLLAKRFGLDLGPDTVWNLAPWTWAVDWFTNAGDVISNIDSYAIDGSVLRYGYMMENTIVTDTYSMTGVRDILGNAVPVQPLVLETNTKMRVGADPYGFGVSWEGLSAFQTSILVALGLTKGRR